MSRIAAQHAQYPSGDVRNNVWRVHSTTAGELDRKRGVYHRSRTASTTPFMPSRQTVSMRAFQDSVLPILGAVLQSTNLFRRSRTRVASDMPTIPPTERPQKEA